MWFALHSDQYVPDLKKPLTRRTIDTDHFFNSDCSFLSQQRNQTPTAVTNNQNKSRIKKKTRLRRLWELFETVANSWDHWQFIRYHWQLTRTDDRSSCSYSSFNHDHSLNSTQSMYTIYSTKLNLLSYRPPRPLPAPAVGLGRGSRLASDFQEPTVPDVPLLEVSLYQSYILV